MVNWPLMNSCQNLSDVKTACPEISCPISRVSCRTRHAIDRHGRVTGPSPTYSSNVLTHRKKGAPPWKSDSSYAMRCARGHVKIQSELSSRSVCVVCYREISRPEWLQTMRKVFQRIRERMHQSPRFAARWLVNEPRSFRAGQSTSQMRRTRCF